WMICSNGTGKTIDYFLVHIRLQNPDTDPRRFMSDRDPAQMGKIIVRYPISQLLLCWWHAPHAWQKHIVIAHYPELWEKLKKWYRLTDETEFQSCWEEIKELSPPSVIDYFEKYWLGDKWVPLWSGVYCQDRTVYEEGDTNMLVEAWHHILKTIHMNGMRNRRVNQLIHTLLNITLPHYIAIHRAQQFGFQGPDLGLQAHNEIHKRARTITSESIEEIESGRIFTVKSQSTPGRQYTVDLETYTCEPCPSFPRISFCKHICAVEDHFPDLVVPRSFTPPSQPWDDVNVVSPTINPVTVTPSPRSEHPGPVLPVVSENDKLLLHYIVDKLQHIQCTNIVLPRPLADTLRQLNGDLADATGDTGILPKTVTRVAPNEHSGWEKTSEIMGAKHKKRQRTHTDPHSGG
ncbi:hypothetical protein DFH07DRAFT_736904, partial [Mycena maculata]